VPWKTTEKHPEYSDQCRRICDRYGVKFEDFDIVRIAIEENLEDDPIAGSVAVSEALPEIRRFIYEPLPTHWGLPPLVIVLRIESEPASGPREFTLLEIWTEEELEELA
jgi:hypothetical protein